MVPFNQPWLPLWHPQAGRVTETMSAQIWNNNPFSFAERISATELIGTILNSYIKSRESICCLLYLLGKICSISVFVSLLLLPWAITPNERDS